MESKTRIFVISSALIILVIVAITTVSTTGLFGLTNKNTIKIGFTTPLSGDAAAWGISIKEGFDYKVKQINNSGGINGKIIEIIYEDDQCDAKQGVIAFNKLIDTDKVKIITGSACSSVALAVIPITQQNRVLYLASGATEDSVPRQGDLVFRIWPSDFYETKVIANYAINKLILKNFATIYVSDYISSKSLNNKFIEIIKENNKNILIQESVLTQNKDFTTTITKVLDKNPEAIYIPAQPEITVLLINQLKKLGYKGYILPYGAALQTEGVLNSIYSKEKIIFAEPKRLQLTSFWKEYKADTDKEADTLSALGYDSALLLELGLKECGESNECIKNYWLNTKEFNLTRANISFDQYGDADGFEFEVKELK